jgi:DNA-binding NtrC family response regulator
MSHKILIVDDEKDMLLLLQRILAERTEHEIITTTDPRQALELARTQEVDLVLTDLKMPKMSGLGLLQEIRKIDPHICVVILTAYGTIENAVEATHKGAFDYITKPFRKERVLLTVEKGLQWRTMLLQNEQLKATLQDQKEGSLIGVSPHIQDIMSRLRQVAPTQATVLITGPSGTGKEVVAKALHRHSGRPSHKLVTINCTAIPEEVMESELFGHVKGAFTGAWQTKKGLVDEADGGTLFLDEIGDLNPSMQTKLLRLLEQGEFKPVGSVVTKQADLRFIAATNQDLVQAIDDKRFREDLYYRLNVIRLHLPSLAERSEDIPLLAYHFLNKFKQVYAKSIEDISPEALSILTRHPWPGNVRELENVIERAVIYCRTKTLSAQDLALQSEGRSDFVQIKNMEELTQLPFKEAKETWMRRFVTFYIQSLLERCDGNISKAAEDAGVNRQYLHQLLRDVDISPEAYRNRG